MGNSNLLFESIFKQKLSAADTREFLVKITDEHPYFSPAQFFLLLKTNKGTESYNAQAAKTAVLFNNPYWLQFQLHEKEHIVEENRDGDPSLKSGKEEEEGMETDMPEIPESNGTHTADEPVASIADKVTTGPGWQASADNDPFLPQTEVPGNDLLDEKEEETPVPDQPGPSDAGTSTGLTDQGTAAEPAIDERTISVQENNAGEVILAAEPLALANEETDPPQAGEIPVTGEEPEKGTEETESAATIGNAGEAIGTTHSGHFNTDSVPLVNEPGSEDEPIQETATEPLNFKLNIDTPVTTEENITFEPLHTSDYFASLGIKLSTEIKPSDKLGKQLKSFTEWLKTMKKIHVDQLPPLSGEADISIQKLAEQSNKEDAVVTEAMADVLLLQGKKEKAIEVYQKLSLLNPSKSTYFAAKIDQLKEL